MLNTFREKKKKKSREELREERIAKHVAALRESEQKIGQLIPVIESQFGIVSGSKRRKANPDWRTKKVTYDDEYEHWRNVANANIQIEPSKKEWAEYVNKAIAALKKDNKNITNAEIIKRLEKDFGLPRARIYELMSDEFKKECKKADLHLDGAPKGDESKSAQTAQLSQVVDTVFKGVKGFVEKPNMEQVLVAELKKFDIVPEVKVKFDRPYKYPQPYYADLKIGNLTFDILGKSSQEEREERDEFFVKKGMYPIHLPRPMVKKYAPVIAALIHGFVKYWKAS